MMKKRKRIIIASSFSLKMLENHFHELVFEPLHQDVLRELVQDSTEIVSIVGHESTAKLFSHILGVEIPVNRVDYIFRPSDLLIVGLPELPRLPEGKVLSDEELKDIPIRWWKIEFA